MRGSKSNVGAEEQHRTRDLDQHLRQQQTGGGANRRPDRDLDQEMGDELPRGRAEGHAQPDLVPPLWPGAEQQADEIGPGYGQQQAEGAGHQRHRPGGLADENRPQAGHFRTPLPYLRVFLAQSLVEESELRPGLVFRFAIPQPRHGGDEVEPPLAAFVGVISHGTQICSPRGRRKVAGMTPAML